MELRHLRYFVAAAEHEHFRHAAEELAIAQPALTRQVRQLEEELGIALFERQKRRVRLTTGGRSFLEDARLLLQEVDRAARRAQLAAHGQLGVLSVGYVDTSVYGGIVPEIFSRFRKEAKDVQLDLFTMNSVEQWAALNMGKIDAGFVYQVPDVASFRSAPVWKERVVVSLPKGHPLARRPSLRLLDLQNEPFVWIPRSVSPRYFDLINDALRTASVTLNVVQEARTEFTLLSLVAGGVGLSFAVVSTKRRTPDNVVLRDVEDLNVTVHLRVLWRVDNGSTILPRFLGVVRDVRGTHRSRRGQL